MTLGPRTKSWPPPGMPSTGSSRTSMPGSSPPTVPRRLSVGLFTAMTGEASVAP